MLDVNLYNGKCDKVKQFCYFRSNITKDGQSKITKDGWSKSVIKCRIGTKKFILNKDNF